MGANAIRSYTVGFVFLSLFSMYLVPSSRDVVLSWFPVVGIPEETVLDLLSKIGFGSRQAAAGDVSGSQSQGHLFTKEELAKYDGGPDSLGLYLAILGDVFDVAKGAQHYKPGSSYDFFAGRDASRSYITGTLDENVDADDLIGLEESAYAGLADWLSFYKDEYEYKGKLIGRYYDKSGKPTDELKRVQLKIQEGESNKWLERNENEIFPPCNSEWSKEKGSRVWCTNKSGVIDRDWVGVPRKLYKTGKDPRCVCVRDSGPPSDNLDAKEHSNRGDLEHPHLQEYHDCPVTASSCKVNHP